MEQKLHHFKLALKWAGNTGTGTSSYRAYKRTHIISHPSKPDLLLSSDPIFRGDASMYNPEELLIASLSSCHMLWLLHLCADEGITVINYRDEPTGIMIIKPDGSGRMKEVTLHPEVTILASEKLDMMVNLHQKAHQMCFIANSVNFPVVHLPLHKVDGALKE